MMQCNLKAVDCPYKLQSEFAPVPCIGTQEQCAAIVKIRNGLYKVFIICSVRSASEEYRTKLETYVSELESMGIKVHLPHRDTNQNARGFDICMQNANAIKDADEVHIFYNSSSQGTHFDMGVSFALGKRVVVVENEKYVEGKSFSRMLEEWQNEKSCLNNYWKG